MQRNAKKNVLFYSKVNLVVVFTGPSDQTANRDARTAAVRGPPLRRGRAPVSSLQV